MIDPTQVVAIRVMAPDGEEIVPAVGTVYRTSDEAGELTEDLVFVAMTQGQYNRIQGMLTPDTFRNRLDQILADADVPDEVVLTTGSGEEIKQQSYGHHIDTRPHSRACGVLRHEHGSFCHPNCPTCGGKA